MIIRKIQLTNFRNFKNKTLQFLPKTTIIVGPNGSGKTNIIESIYLLSTGKSFHARLEEEMVSYDEEIARVKGAIVGDDDGGGTNMEVVLTRGELTIGKNPEKVEKVARKRLLVNGVGKRLIDFAGNFRTVLFGPWDMELVTDSPSVRRRFLDNLLSQTDREYRRAILSYEKGLRQRNKLLLGIREENMPRSLLLFWDKLLIKNGDYIASQREEFITFVNSEGSKVVDGEINSKRYSLEYDKSAISEARLEQYKSEEVAAATTLVGPHRDDFVFKIQNPKSKIQKKRELARYGSRGEQRMGVLWLKLAELAYVEQRSTPLRSSSFEGQGKPTLLLDDIFSELDHEHREIVMDVVKGTKKSASPGAGQVIITTADPHFIEDFKKVEKIRLK